MEFDAKRFLAALEGDGDISDAVMDPNVTAGGAAAPNEASPTAVGPVLTQADSSAVLMMMLRKQMGTKEFGAFIENGAAELEVFNVIPNAEAMVNSVALLGRTSANVAEVIQKGIAAICVTMGQKSNHAAAEALAAAETSKRSAMSDLVDCYGDAAKTEIARILADYKALAQPMGTHTGEILIANINDLLTKLQEG